jgi:hypothetical protein
MAGEVAAPKAMTERFEDQGGEFTTNHSNLSVSRFQRDPPLLACEERNEERGGIG